MKNEILRLEKVSLNCYGIKALENITFTIFKGEIVGLVGSNGSGKSTLAYILAGIFKQYKGNIFLKGKKLVFDSPLHAVTKGICCIRQESELVLNMSVAENILLGTKKSLKMYTHTNLMHDYAKRICKSVDLDVDMGIMGDKLTLLQKKLTEIARALAGNVSLLVLDEPTTFLTEKEADIFNRVLTKLRDEGISILYISHNLKKILDLTDRIIVMRYGLCVSIENSRDSTEKQLIMAMTGEKEMLREKNYAKNDKGCPEEELLRVDRLSTIKLLKNVSFTIEKNQILGIVGAAGSGKAEIAQILFGLETNFSGEIYINRKQVILRSPRDAIRFGIGYLPEERRRDALISDLSTEQNVTLSVLDRVSKRGVIRHNLENSLVNFYGDYLDMKMVSHDKKVDSLSGGDQLKVILAKLLAAKPKILILNEPIRGIDIAVKREILRLIQNMKKDMAIIWISSEIEDVMDLFDKILLMDNGEVIHAFTEKECTWLNVTNFLNT